MLGWQIFLACMLAVLTLNVCRSAQHAVSQGDFGLFEGDTSTVFFEARSRFASWLPLIPDVSALTARGESFLRSKKYFRSKCECRVTLCAL